MRLMFLLMLEPDMGWMIAPDINLGALVAALYTVDLKFDF